MAAADGEGGGGGSGADLLMDDMKPDEWLDEIGLPQYTETFASNFCFGGLYMSRKRLAQVKLSSFPHMNITNYEHQKIIMEHIRHSLKYAYSSHIRKREVEERMAGPHNVDGRGGGGDGEGDEQGGRGRQKEGQEEQEEKQLYDEEQGAGREAEATEFDEAIPEGEEEDDE